MLYFRKRQQMQSNNFRNNILPFLQLPYIWFLNKRSIWLHPRLMAMTLDYIRFIRLSFFYFILFRFFFLSFVSWAICIARQSPFTCKTITPPAYIACIIPQIRFIYIYLLFIVCMSYSHILIFRILPFDIKYMARSTSILHIKKKKKKLPEKKMNASIVGVS